MEKEKLVSLVRAVQNGNETAAGDLYDAFYDGIYYFILKSVDNDPELAADLTQDTFMEILETIGKLQEPAAFVTWSRQIAYHRCTAYFRKHREILLDEQEDGYSAFDTVEEERTEFIPDEALDKEDFKQTIQAMINELPNEQRSALVLRYFNEISVKEIAQIQGVSEGTVKSRLNYARKYIQQAVESYEKRSGVRLHITGVVPMLLWFFRACRRGKNMAVATGTAGAAYTGLGSSASASAAGTGAAAAGTGAAVATGAKVSLAAATKVAATKVVAVVAAAAVGIAGVTVAVTTLLKKPYQLPEVWSGYIQENYMDPERYQMNPGTDPRDFEIPLEGGNMFVELEFREATETEILGTIEITWDDGEKYQSEFVMTSDYGTTSFTMEVDPLYLRLDEDSVERPMDSGFSDLFEDNALYELYFLYNPEKDTLEWVKDWRYLNTLTGELTRESGKTTVLTYLKGENIYFDKEKLTYFENDDGSFRWSDENIGERIEAMYMQGPQEDDLWGMLFFKYEDDPFVWVYLEMPRWDGSPVIIPGEVGGYPVKGLLCNYSNTYPETVILPDTLEVISANTFESSYITELELPESLRKIGTSAFYYCNNLDSMVIPEGVETLGAHPVMKCRNLKSFYLPSTVTRMGVSPVYGCHSLEVLEVAEGNPVYHSSGNCIIETESKTLVAGCGTSEIPADGSVTAIGKYAFAANDGVQELVIPEGVEEIGTCAFAKCNNLREITLPRSLKTIDDRAFKFCEALREIRYSGTMAEFMEIRGIRWDAPYHGFDFIIHCIDGDLAVG